MNVIKVEDLSKVYSSENHHVNALEKISFSAEKGDFLTITGPSGSGKSTLMNILGCLDIQTSGMYYLNGTDISNLSAKALTEIRNRSVGFIFQSFNLVSSLTAAENVELPLIYRGVRKKHRKELVEQALDAVSMSNRAHHLPSQMSGGQRQRVAVARAIAANPPLILADEPTGSLDSEASKEVTSILKKMAEDGHTVIIITHDKSIAESSQKVINITNGRIN